VEEARMPQLVPDDYFRTGVFANARPGELLGSYTCVECAVRSVTWEAFRAHRAECTGRPWAAAPHFGSRLLQQLSALAPGASLVVESGGVVESAAVAESGGVAEAAETERTGAVPVRAGRPTVGEERDPFLDASPAALQELERWRREQEEREEREGHPVPPRFVAA
jgi:hypothetical protein